MSNIGLSAQWQKSFKDFVRSTGLVTKKILLLEIESNPIQARETIAGGIPMQGVRLWFLLASCLIASIGLNTNSSAVIIGAMLISPLMGPILGLGFGMALASRRMIRQSVQNLLFAIFISLVVASLYFVVSPFQDATPEILSRTAPNLLDLLVAIAAGFSGVVAMNSTGLAGAVPGVAIATAIMPPLCASAYGIAHGNWKIALGAFYLFFVNAFAIAVVTYLLFKRMHFADEGPDAGENAKLRPAVISLVLLLIIAPLGWSLWDAWRDNFVQRSVARLVQTYKNQLEVVSWQWDGTKSKRLVLYNFRKAAPALRFELEEHLRSISPQASLELHESNLSPDTEDIVTQLKTTQFSALVKNPKIIDGLLRLATTENSAGDLMATVLSYEKDLSALLGEGRTVRAFIHTEDPTSEVLFLVGAKTRADRARTRRDINRLKDWLQTKMPEGVTFSFEVTSSGS